MKSFSSDFQTIDEFEKVNSLEKNNGHHTKI